MPSSSSSSSSPRSPFAPLPLIIRNSECSCTYCLFVGRCPVCRERDIKAWERNKAEREERERRAERERIEAERRARREQRRYLREQLNSLIRWRSHLFGNSCSKGG